MVEPITAIYCPCYFMLRQCGPNLIITLGYRAPSCAIGPYQKSWDNIRNLDIRLLLAK